MSNRKVQKLDYEKPKSEASVDYCTIETCEDGSVYVSGDDIGELIFEFSPNNLQNAIAIVEQCGYRQVQK